jgi:hypothetical protein
LIGVIGLHRALERSSGNPILALGKRRIQARFLTGFENELAALTPTSLRSRLVDHFVRVLLKQLVTLFLSEGFPAPRKRRPKNESNQERAQP